MKVIRFNAAERYEPEKDWNRVNLCNEENISIEHFVKPPNHASPSHSHPNTQVLVVVKGRISVKTEKDGEIILEEGDTAYIPENEVHVVKNILDEPSIGIDIFVPGRSFDFWLKRRK